MYPVGHTVVLYNVETKVQKFTPGTPESEGITALAVSPNKKFLAVAERADKGTISVYDLQTLKRRKVLVSSETGSKVSFAPGQDQPKKQFCQARPACSRVMNMHADAPAHAVCRPVNIHCVKCCCVLCLTPDTYC